MTIHDVGDTLRITASFTDLAGNAADPTEVVVKIRDPAGTVTTPTAVNDPDTVGAFYYDLPLTSAGTWTYRFEGTGSVSAAEEETVTVARSAFSEDAPPSSTGITCSPWATLNDLCSPCTTLEPDFMEVMIQIASDVLYDMSGRQWKGTCSTTVRPYNLSCSCFSPTKCTKIHEVSLGSYPVTAITSVKVREYNGGPLTTLNSSLYRIDNRRTLVRLNNADGTNPGWPKTQDLHQGSDGTGVFFEVAYSYGASPPPGGVHAAATLACEMALACDESSERCRLPKRTQSVVRQGLSQDFVAPELFIQEGLTGIYEVDLWVKSVNPKRMRRSAAIYSPDLTTRYRVAGT